jgi:uncharacterized protein YdiU (UPF0061 family)
MEKHGAKQGRGWKLEQSYLKLPETFYTRQAPQSVASPRLVLFNRPLAKELGIDPDSFGSDENIAAVFSGNNLPDESEPFAQAYAGHQFGHFTKLGDGRAVVLGEQIDPQGKRWDLQFKGSGQTPYSRRGDGRAALGPMLREYLISEAMHALGIPTTRSLAVVATGEPVYRENILPGAILTRVASSHIRVGTFEYAVAFQGKEAVRALADYAIARHYPSLQKDPQPYVAFFREVVKRQAHLTAQWMLVGFIHGVMNTDNMLISGETIDYGPCAFMDYYNPGTVFSSIDRNGRYAYGNQPAIAQWNLARLAETLLPLFDEDESRAIEIAKEGLGGFVPEHSQMWLTGMAGKLGIASLIPEDQALIEDMLRLMQEKELDFTNTFASLAQGAMQDASLPEDWLSRWKARKPAQTLMQKSNPQVIPRNHLVEAALSAAVEQGDLAPFQDLLAALQKPFSPDKNLPGRFFEPAPRGGEPYQTFCGT